MSSLIRSWLRHATRHGIVAKRFCLTVANREPEYPKALAITRELARTSWRLLLAP